MIEITNLTKQFGNFTAVDKLSFSVDAGEVVGFLGPNGAGKSTTMKMLTGFLEASSGTIKIGGKSFSEQAIAIKQNIGYLPEGAPAYADMTVAQFLDFIADVRGLKGEHKQQRLLEVVKRIELVDVLNRNIENLSKGFKRRVGLAQAIIHDPAILILDEPTDGLDPNQKHQVRQLIQNLAKEKLVIVSTHILEEVTAVCNRAIIIANGRKIFDGTPQALQAKSGYHHAVTIELNREVNDISMLEKLPEVKQVEVEPNRLTVLPIEQNNIFDKIYQVVQQQKWEIDAIYSEKGRLDDIFRELTIQQQTEEQS